MGMEGVHYAFVVHFYGDITKVQSNDSLKSFPKCVSFDLVRGGTS